MTLSHVILRLVILCVMPFHHSLGIGISITDAICCFCCYLLLPAALSITPLSFCFVADDRQQSQLPRGQRWVSHSARHSAHTSLGCRGWRRCRRSGSFPTAGSCQLHNKQLSCFSSQRQLQLRIAGSRVTGSSGSHHSDDFSRRQCVCVSPQVG